MLLLWIGGVYTLFNAHSSMGNSPFLAELYPYEPRPGVLLVQGRHRVRIHSQNARFDGSVTVKFEQSCK